MEGQAQQGREECKRESPGIAGDDLAGRLGFREDGMGAGKRPFARLEQLARRLGPELGLEHQVEQRRMLQGEANVGPAPAWSGGS